MVPRSAHLIHITLSSSSVELLMFLGIRPILVRSTLAQVYQLGLHSSVENHNNTEDCFVPISKWIFSGSVIIQPFSQPRHPSTFLSQWTHQPLHARPLGPTRAWMLHTSSRTTLTFLFTKIFLIDGPKSGHSRLTPCSFSHTATSLAWS